MCANNSGKDINFHLLIIYLVNWFFPLHWHMWRRWILFCSSHDLFARRSPFYFILLCNLCGVPSARSRAKTPRVFPKQITRNCKNGWRGEGLISAFDFGEIISGVQTEKTHAQIDVRLACDVREKKKKNPIPPRPLTNGVDQKASSICLDQPLPLYWCHYLDEATKIFGVFGNELLICVRVSVLDLTRWICRFCWRS